MARSPLETAREDVNTCPEVADEIKQTTCYMCACRCGINVYLKDGKIRYLEGNPDHPVNQGVLCAKGSAGIMRSEEHTSELQSLMRISYAVFCLKKKILPPVRTYQDKPTRLRSKHRQ